MVIDINQADFQKEVITRSQKEPVVVDFWAPWCGPCRMLGPTLERLANEPNSGFTLAKLNVDHNHAISQQYGVQGIPAVKAFVNGRIVNEFVGALPEPQIRAFLTEVKSQFHPQNGTTPKGDPLSLLKQGDGCGALQLLEGEKYNNFAHLTPLAKFLCYGRKTQQDELNGIYQQVKEALRRREPSAALYNLLMAYHREDEEGKTAVRKIAKGVLSLHPENNQIQTYTAQFG